MPKNSAIEWTHHTWSPWEGCQKTGSPACDHCYAEARNARFGGGVAPNWGPHAERRLTADASWGKPLAWDRAAGRRGVRERVFPSLCDPFDNKAPAGARVRFGQLILATPNLIWLLLTKRVGNAAAMLAEMFPDGVPAHVWLGATVVTQAEADRDVEQLRQTKYDAGIRVAFLSVEPMMGPIDVRKHLWPACGWWKGPHRSYAEAKAAGVECGMKPQALLSAHVARSLVDWIIVGGESGPGARPMHPDWARSLRDQCAAAGVPFLFKQWGEWAPGGEWIPNAIGSDEYAAGRATILHSGVAHGRGFFPENARGAAHVDRVGKVSAGRLLDGVQHDQVPA